MLFSPGPVGPMAPQDQAGRQWAAQATGQAPKPVSQEQPGDQEEAARGGASARSGVASPRTQAAPGQPPSPPPRGGRAAARSQQSACGHPRSRAPARSTRPAPRPAGGGQQRREGWGRDPAEPPARQPRHHARRQAAPARPHVIVVQRRPERVGAQASQAQACGNAGSWRHRVSPAADRRRSSALLFPRSAGRREEAPPGFVQTSAGRLRALRVHSPAAPRHPESLVPVNRDADFPRGCAAGCSP